MLLAREGSQRFSTVFQVWDKSLLCYRFHSHSFTTGNSYWCLSLDLSYLGKKINKLYNVPLWLNYLVSLCAFKRFFKKTVYDFLNLIPIKFNCKKVKVQLCCTPAALDPPLLMTTELFRAADQTGKAGSLQLLPLSPPRARSHSSPELLLKTATGGCASMQQSMI